ncbi:MAG: cytochrome-c peroxidase [Gammaproteobacteria bacterium]
MRRSLEGIKVLRSNVFAALLLGAAGSFLLSGCAEQPAEESVTADDSAAETIETNETTPQPATPVRDARLELFAPLPELMESPAHSITLAKVNLGRKLYYDTRLSKNQDVSCNTCHLLGNFGVDGLPASIGHLEQVGLRNAPTVYNAAGHLAQFWDGRAEDVEAQAKSQLLDPIEMAMPDEAAVETILRSVLGYAPMFAAAFPEDEQPVTFANTASAIGAFERGLTTPSRFDDYLAGDDEALSEIELEGLITFLDVGCATCHSGAYVGGSTYQKIGLVKAWVDKEDVTDLGRFDITGDEADKQVFKVPSLRNISHTAPYFHDGSVSSLNEAVRLMGEYQLGVELSNEQVISIIAFLNALDGRIDEAYVAIPELPESSESTPPPDPT